MVLEYRHEQRKDDFPNDEPLTRKRNLTFVLLLRHSYLAHDVPVEEPSRASIADIRPSFDHLVGTFARRMGVSRPGNADIECPFLGGKADEICSR